MAGSWQHLIENLGDAYEAAEECYGMVQVLAEQLANVTGQPREDLIRSACARYQVGLSIGGVQKS